MEEYNQLFAVNIVLINCMCFFLNHISGLKSFGGARRQSSQSLEVNYYDYRSWSLIVKRGFSGVIYHNIYVRIDPFSGQEENLSAKL